MTPQLMWAIVGLNGLYIGTHLRRVDMIAQHVHKMMNDADGNRISEWPQYGQLTDVQRHAWKECRKRGDRCIRVEIRAVQSKNTNLRLMRTGEATRELSC